MPHGLPHFENPNPTLTDDDIARLTGKATNQVGAINAPAFTGFDNTDRSNRNIFNQGVNRTNFDFDESLRGLQNTFSEKFRLQPGVDNQSGLFGSGVAVARGVRLQTELGRETGSLERQRNLGLNELQSNLNTGLTNTQANRSTLRGGEGQQIQELLDSLMASTLGNRRDDIAARNQQQQQQFENQLSLQSLAASFGGGGGGGGFSPGGGSSGTFQDGILSDDKLVELVKGLEEGFNKKGQSGGRTGGFSINNINNIIRSHGADPNQFGFGSNRMAQIVQGWESKKKPASWIRQRIVNQGLKPSDYGY